MNALTHEFDLSQATMLPPLAPGLRELANPAALAAQWEAVHDAAAAVGMLAQLGREEPGEEVLGLPDRAATVGGFAYEMVARGVDDLAAVMQPGLRALLSLTAQGQDTTAAALTLWREFHSARAVVIGFAPLA